jgi:hypothetical protein
MDFSCTFLIIITIRHPNWGRYDCNEF